MEVFQSPHYKGFKIFWKSIMSNKMYIQSFILDFVLKFNLK